MTTRVQSYSVKSWCQHHWIWAVKEMAKTRQNNSGLRQQNQQRRVFAEAWWKGVKRCEKAFRCIVLPFSRSSRSESRNDSCPVADPRGFHLWERQKCDAFGARNDVRKAGNKLRQRRRGNLLARLETTEALLCDMSHYVCHRYRSEKNQKTHVIRLSRLKWRSLPEFQPILKQNITKQWD